MICQIIAMTASIADLTQENTISEDVFLQIQTSKTALLISAKRYIVAVLLNRCPKKADLYIKM